MVGNTGRTPDPRRIRRLRSPRTFDVEADAEGVPLCISVGGRQQDVSLIRRPWRIDQHWWRSDHIQREYFGVAPQDGPPLTIYHDLVSDSWYRQEF
jgi:hypothetical protein